MVSTKQLKESKFVNWLEGIAKSNFLAKSIVGIVIWVVALIPVWLYMFIRWLVEPVGFWQEIAILALTSPLWFAQIIACVFAAVISFAVIFED